MFDGSGSDSSSRSLGFDLQENSDAVKDEEDLYYTKEDLYECYEIYSAGINVEQGRGTNNAQGNWECCSQECGEDSDVYKEIQCSYGEMTNTSYGTLYENVPCRGLENDQGHECYDDVTNKQSSGYQNNRDAQSSFYDTSHNNKTYEDKETHLYDNITIDHNSSYVKSLIDRWEARS